MFGLLKTCRQFSFEWIEHFYNYLFDKNKGKLFFTAFFHRFFSSAKISRFIISVGGEVGSRYDRGRGLRPADREADYRCLRPLQRKTSELEREEEYSSIFRVLQARSRNLLDRHQN
jgi:hypothetical protein